MRKCLELSAAEEGVCLSCVLVLRADWGTYRLALWQMYSTSCIIYVCSFSYAQKPDVPSIVGSPRRKHVGTRRRKPNNNKQVFSVTNSSHFGTNNKKDFFFSGLSTAGGLKLVPLFFILFTVFFFFIVSVCLFTPYQVDEGGFFFCCCCCCIACVVSRSLLECSFGRVTESSLRAKQTAVAYG